MTQDERRIYLIHELLLEQPQYSDIEIPADEQEQKNLLRSLFNIRMPLPGRNREQRDFRPVGAKARRARAIFMAGRHYYFAV